MFKKKCDCTCKCKCSGVNCWIPTTSNTRRTRTLETEGSYSNIYNGLSYVVYSQSLRGLYDFQINSYSDIGTLIYSRQLGQIFFQNSILQFGYYATTEEVERGSINLQLRFSNSKETAFATIGATGITNPSVYSRVSSAPGVGGEEYSVTIANNSGASITAINGALNFFGQDPEDSTTFDFSTIDNGASQTTTETIAIPPNVLFTGFIQTRYMGQYEDPEDPEDVVDVVSPVAQNGSTTKFTVVSSLNTTTNTRFVSFNNLSSSSVYLFRVKINDETPDLIVNKTVAAGKTLQFSANVTGNSPVIALVGSDSTVTVENQSWIYELVFAH